MEKRQKATIDGNEAAFLEAEAFERANYIKTLQIYKQFVQGEV